MKNAFFKNAMNFTFRLSLQFSLLLCSFGLFGLFSQAQTQELFPAPQGKNLTEDFLNYYQNPDSALNQEDLEELKSRYKIVFVPGFMANLLSTPQIVVPFKEQKSWLKSQKIPYEDVKLSTQDPVKENRKILADFIRKSDRPLIFLCHSKGGLDTLTALLNDPQLQNREKVAGLITIQSPFYGTPMANSFYDNAFLRMLSGNFLVVCGGHFHTLKCLTTASRGKHLRKWKDQLGEFLNKIPVINFASSVEKNPFPFAKKMMSPDPSDGVVPTWSAILPGADYVVMDNVNHMSTVDKSHDSRDSSKNLKRIDFTQALLKLLLQKLRQNPGPSQQIAALGQEESESCHH